MYDSLICSPEVREALNSKAPVVALETTIVTHGMPYPQNVETARSVEAQVRLRGAVPATVAVMDGGIHIGLSEPELERLALADDVLKLSRNDLAYALGGKKTGATTVAATMICAHLAGVRVFATGGIGGVHRGVEQSMDISADLEELAITPVAVVCAGAKALLDLPRTLEYLETRGVPVAGYCTDEFPAFWSASSGLKAPIRLDSAEEIARMLSIKWGLGLKGGAVIANPIPAQNEIARDEMERYIDQAIRDSQGISGKRVTPFLLQRIFELTEGRSLNANIALVENNARLAADIAKALSAIS